MHGETRARCYLRGGGVLVLVPAAVLPCAVAGCPSMSFLLDTSTAPRRRVAADALLVRLEIVWWDRTTGP